MNYLILAILASVAVSVFLKLARTYNIQTEQAIFVNYIVAASATYFFLTPDITALTSLNYQSPALPIILALGVLLPSIFIVMAHAVRHAGIIKTDAAQRLALFIPILAALTIFGEALTLQKKIGLGLAFAALFCLITKSSSSKSRGANNAGAVALCLIAVWLGFGIIDVLFKQTAKMGSAFPATLLAAFVLSGAVMLVYLLAKRTAWHATSLASGIILGALNFANILCYVRAHQAMKDTPTTVFAGMNVGVIALGAIVGAVVFRERISRLNMLGIVLAISAIGCLFYLDKLASMLGFTL
jgi:drug/metabolite transporter (DMT)-like permease